MAEGVSSRAMVATPRSGMSHKQKNGKRKQRTKGGFKNKKAAQTFLSEQLNRINKNDYTAP
jgi:Arm DNA-binding domain